MTLSLKDRLPEGLEGLFWDTDPGLISMTAHQRFVVVRVLGRGSWEQIRIVRSRLGDDALRAELCATRARALSAQRVRLWELVLGLPSEVVDAWLQDPGRRQWEEAAR